MPERWWIVYLRCIRVSCPWEIVASRHSFECGWHLATGELVALGLE